MKNENFKKTCPICGKDQFYSRKDVLYLAIKNSSICLNCSQKRKILSNETKNKISQSLKGKKRPQEVCNKISFTMKEIEGRPHTEETKYKLRLATINDLKRKGIFPSNTNHNPKACEFIDKLNKEKGWNLQHALNGGEVELYGYFVDGYDKEKNIIFEYDELNHERRDRKQKDLVRQENLLKKIKPAMFIRYNEKAGKLYKIKSYENQ